MSFISPQLLTVKPDLRTLLRVIVFLLPNRLPKMAAKEVLFFSLREADSCSQILVVRDYYNSVKYDNRFNISLKESQKREEGTGVIFAFQIEIEKFSHFLCDII